MRELIDLAPGLTRGLAAGALLDDAGAALAEKLEAEAATATHGFAGAVLLAALGIEAPGRPIVHLAAHDIEIAGPLRDLLRHAGALPQAVGSVDRATRADLEAALATAAAALWVADERLAAAHLVGLPEFRHLAHQRGIPTIVLAPSGRNIEGLLDAGADLLVLDAATAFAGPPLGIIAGRADLVGSVRRAQGRGLGRLTAPAPEHLTRLQACLDADHTAALQARRARLGELLTGNAGLRLRPTAMGLVLHVDPPTAGFTASDLAHALATGSPGLVTDDRDSHEDRLALDLVRLDEASFETVLATLARTLDQPIPPAPWP